MLSRLWGLFPVLNKGEMSYEASCAHPADGGGRYCGDRVYFLHPVYRPVCPG